MLKRICLPLFVGIIILLFSCQTEKKPDNQNSSSNKEQTFQLKVNRFEKELFSVPVDSINSEIPNLEKKYGVFWDIFTNKIINIGSSKKPDFPKYLKNFLTDRYMFMTYQKVMKVYPDLTVPTHEMEDAFVEYRSFFPEKPIPHVYTLISGYNQSVITADTILGISIEKYLGKDFEYYQNMGLPLYQRRLMSKEYIATDALRGWCYSEFLYDDSAENVLTNILYEGKIIYLMKNLFPEKHDTVIMGYSAKQLKWTKENLKPMWTYLIENKLVFSTDYMTINKLINPAPFTAMFNTESPGRAVVWLGYQIIDSYMKNNKITIPALLADKNYQGILEKSKFNP